MLNEFKCASRNGHWSTLAFTQEGCEMMVYSKFWMDIRSRKRGHVASWVWSVGFHRRVWVFKEELPSTLTQEDTQHADTGKNEKEAERESNSKMPERNRRKWDKGKREGEEKERKDRMRLQPLGFEMGISSLVGKSVSVVGLDGKPGCGTLHHKSTLATSRHLSMVIKPPGAGIPTSQGLLPKSQLTCRQFLWNEGTADQGWFRQRRTWAKENWGSTWKV